MLAPLPVPSAPTDWDPPEIFIPPTPVTSHRLGSYAEYNTQLYSTVPPRGATSCPVVGQKPNREPPDCRRDTAHTHNWSHTYFEHVYNDGGGCSETSSTGPVRATAMSSKSHTTMAESRQLSRVRSGPTVRSQQLQEQCVNTPSQHRSISHADAVLHTPARVPFSCPGTRYRCLPGARHESLSAGSRPPAAHRR